ncbi:MAG: hypothetical protein K8823_527 [Cenarchaeum symbiont of Oopsacas minuta]|nr:hypothetical protein [Cenarchaeum symbiont of Oopsacas minuta]
MKDGRFRTVLATRGRVTGIVHKSELYAVMFDGDVYLTRHKPDSDWYKNCIANGRVSITIDKDIIFGMAEPVKDENIVRCISELKYPNQVRATEHRVAIRVRLDAQ